MFTQPKNCCCCFGLRTGTLILATLGLLGDAILAALFIAASTQLEFSKATVYGLGGFYIFFALLNLWFLVGAAKRNYTAVKAFSIFIIVQVVFFTITQVLRIVQGVEKYKQVCQPGSSAGNCKYQPASLIGSALLSLFVSYLINFHFYFSVKGYARELKAPATTA